MPFLEFRRVLDRKSTRLNSSHTLISYTVFCLKKTNNHEKHANVSYSSTDIKNVVNRRSEPGKPPNFSFSSTDLHTLLHRRPRPCFFFLMRRGPPKSTLFPYTTLFR